MRRYGEGKRGAIRVHAESVDEDHEVVDLRLDGRTLALVVQSLLREHLLVGVVVPAEILQLLLLTPPSEAHLVLDQHDVRADVVQEVTVVRHHHERFVVVLQEVLQPNDGSDIQVVGRLIQQKQVRRREQGCRQRHTNRHSQCVSSPHAPASAQRGRGLVDHFLGEAQSLQNIARRHLGVGQIAIRDLLVDLLQTRNLHLARTVRLGLRLDGVLLLDQVLEDGIALQHLRQHAVLALRNLLMKQREKNDFLLDVHYADVLGEAAHLATCNVPARKKRTSHLPKKGRFADSISTNQTVLAAID